MKMLQVATFALVLGVGGGRQRAASDDANGFSPAQDALTTRILAETQVWTAPTSDSTTVTSSTLRLNADASADSLSFTRTVTSGTYAIAFRYAQRNTYGNYQIYAKGVSVGTLTGYSANTSDTWITTTLGTQTLSGSVVFKFVATGKSAAATDYDIKLDYLEPKYPQQSPGILQGVAI